MLVEDEEGGEAGEDGLQSQQDGGVGWGKVLLGPALDGEGRSCGEEAGHGEGDEQARGDGQIGLACQRQGEGHDDGGDADLKGSKLAGRDSMGGVGQGQEMAGEGDCAGEGQQVSGTDAGEEIAPRRSCRRGEEEEAGEGQECANCGGPAGSRRAGWSQ